MMVNVKYGDVVKMANGIYGRVIATDDVMAKVQTVSHTRFIVPIQSVTLLASFSIPSTKMVS